MCSSVNICSLKHKSSCVKLIGHLSVLCTLSGDNHVVLKVGIVMQIMRDMFSIESVSKNLPGSEYRKNRKEFVCNAKMLLQ